MIGKNNSGKTAVLKLPAMIGESLKGNINEAVKLEFDGIKLGSEYSDLVYNRKILQTPLFRIRNKKETIYCYSKEERKAAMEKLKPKPEITRFK